MFIEGKTGQDSERLECFFCFQACWTYITCPSVQEPVENVKIGGLKEVVGMIFLLKLTAQLVQAATSERLTPPPWRAAMLRGV